MGTRQSKLALWQTEHVKAELKKHYPNPRLKLSISTPKVIDSWM
ncbi:MAG: hypothetical protein IPN18_08020 [Ignavibacteriales bacterium]|nr:hypothetical protein [Ignavibacteriales bacterium]